MTEDGLEAHNTIMCFAHVIGTAAGGTRRLSVLDWGGGLGQYGLLAKGLYPDLNLEYHCADLAVFLEPGRALVPWGQFHATSEVAQLERQFDLVMASGAMQYVEHWPDALKTLRGLTNRFLYVTRLPMALGARSFVTVQRPYAYGYDTEYPGWVLNRQDFLAVASGVGLTVVREYLIAEAPFIPGAPEQPVHRGFLFERSPD